MPRVFCPCGTAYKIAEASIGKKAKCKKCGETFELKLPEDTGPIAIADAPAFDDAVAEAVARGNAAPTKEISVEAQAAAAIVLPPTAGGVSSAAVVNERHEMGAGQYFHDLAATLAFPKNVRSLINFIIMFVILLLGFMGRSVPLFGIFFFLMSLGWYAAFRLGVIASAAAGEEEIPALSFEEGFGGGVALPLFKWVGTWAVVLLPAVVMMVVMGVASRTVFMQGMTGILAATGMGMTLLGLTIAGLALWPMVVLCVCLGGFETLVRVDLIVATLVKTLPMYVLTIGIVFGTQYVDYLWHATGQREAARATFEGTEMEGLVDEDGQFIGDQLTPEQWQELEEKNSDPRPVDFVAGAETSLAYNLIGLGVMLYLEIIAMRAIGLYYFHFKNRFAWDWG